MFAIPCAAAALVFSSFAAPVTAVSYSLTDNYVGQSLLDAFSYMAIDDPTHGRVKYVDKATAVANNLTFASNDRAVLRADSTKVLNPAGVGRDSVRLQSNKEFSTGVTVFDIRHMPQGCGTWPAVWTYAEPWPNVGEVDILEGVNDMPYNHATLHTLPGCAMPASGRNMTGVSVQDNCDWTINGNAGCGVEIRNPASYGPPFNAAGGGWYAFERTTAFIKVWFWSRNDASVPAEVRAGSATVNTDSWGTPVAYFGNTLCDIPRFFGNHRIIINLTFCGDWAGSVYGNYPACPGTCVDYVNNNPAAFTEAYFDFGFIKHYD
ncbi:glycoside hydrolase family 16 protein [Cylindrobasidium torrendii FP15055 ss-10]|uniref:Glycoside hydrolase family 16 protein n=1 Tax=Cylindrobasidium torrendii FP15055 ss-10 TaxID=1314674 RepID=A0A0D7BE46_9AGAR|nr:glycoside hydrolase family 16 protein [Cylindrobasidium torrendii FP15055 ss-10]